MRCPKDGEWRAELETALAAASGAPLGEAAARAARVAHLAACVRCQRRRQRIVADAQLATALTASLGGTAPPPQADAAAAQARVRAAAMRPLPPTPSRRWALVAAAVVVLLVVVATVPGPRSFAANVLAMLRIRHITALPVNPPTLSPASEEQVQSLVRQMISQKLTVTIHSGPPRAAADAAQASAWAGFAVRLPMGAGGPASLNVVGQQAFEMRLDASRLDAILAAAGRPDLQIPAADNGALVAVNIPAAVRAAYGTCGPKPRPAAGCTVLRELPSPIISVPPHLDLNALAQIGLEASGMSADEAAAFCRTVNWRTTLVIPVPEAESTYAQIPVDGVEGILVRFAPRGVAPRRYALSWVRQGIIYSIRGVGAAATGIALAQALP